MQSVFTIHVLITLLMLKTAASKTCDYVSWEVSTFVCPKSNMYFKDLQIPGECCEADDPSYTYQPSDCLTAPWKWTSEG